MPRQKAARLRGIVRTRAAAIGCTQEAMCPALWSDRSTHEAGLRKLKRVLQEGTALAYEDAWDLVHFLLGRPIRCKDGELREVFSLHDFGRPLEWTDTGGFLLPEREQAYREALAPFRAYERALGLLATREKTPALVIFPEQTEHLVRYLELAIVGYVALKSPSKRKALAHALRSALMRYEMQLERSEHGRALVTHLEQRHGRHGVDYRSLFLGLVRGDPSGKSQRRPFVDNPWRGTTR